MIRNPILPGFNPDPSICRVATIITSPPPRSSGIRAYRSTIRGIW